MGSPLPQAQHQMDRQSIAATVERICSSSGFAQADSLQRLLRYLVDLALDGRGAELKEYAIGVEVFGRRTDFDPRLDAIVRVQARKLRQRLAEYYLTPGGQTELIRIDLPKGTYLPLIEDVPIATPAPPPPKRNRLWAIAAAAAGIAAVTVLLAWTLLLRNNRPSTSSGEASIAVLPFNDLSDNGNAYFGEGLAEEILNRLAREPDLKVAARSSAFRFAGAGNKPDAVAVGRQLQVRYVLEGSLRHSNGKVRVNAQLIDTQSGFRRWSSSFDREKSDLLALQEDLASAICDRIREEIGTVAAAKASSPVRPPQVNWEAYDAYLRGLHQWKRTSAEAYQAAIAHFRHAIDVDPAFAPPYHYLALSYSGLAAYSLAPPRETWYLAKTYAEKALQVDDHHFGGHVVLAGYKAWHEWDYAGAEIHYQRALQLGPSQPEIWQFHSSYLAALGRKDEARREMEKAMALDPHSNPVRWGAAQVLYWWGDYAEAQRLLDLVIADEPGYASAKPLQCLIWLAQGREDRVIALPSAPRVVKVEAFRALALQRRGKRAEAARILDQLEKDGVQEDYSLAVAKFEVDPTPEEAIAMLERVAEARMFRPPWLRVDPIFARIVKHPRIPALFQRTNL
jgi:TolB-like protein